MTGRARPLRASTLLAVLGVVFGDIGTSPLYALKVSLQHVTESGLLEAEVLGILSLIFWSLILVVTVKYVALILRADNNGEGGILALMALAQRHAVLPRSRAIYGILGIGGACLFFGDGAITPAISVLSAVEGLQTVYPGFKSWVLPIGGGHPRAVRSAGLRHGADRARVRPRHAHLVPDPRCPRPAADRP